MAKLLAACLALAAVSLLLPSEPSYDPFAWLVWGREIDHGHLDTTGGSSWKPLPVVFTILFAPFSRVDDGTRWRSGCLSRARVRCSHWRSPSGSPRGWRAAA